MSAASSQKLFPEGGSSPVARESRRLGEDRYQFIVQASRDSVALLAMGHVPPFKFWKFCSCCQFNCTNFENYRRKTCITVSSILPELGLSKIAKRPFRVNAKCTDD